MSNPKFEEGRRRAREEALARHRREVRTWKVSCWISFSAAMLLAAHAAWAHKRASAPYRTGSAPKLERVEVITDGYVDKQGRWRSFDTGEPITVKAWRP